MMAGRDRSMNRFARFGNRAIRPDWATGLEEVHSLQWEIDPPRATPRDVVEPKTDSEMERPPPYDPDQIELTQLHTQKDINECKCEYPHWKPINTNVDNLSDKF